MATMNTIRNVFEHDAAERLDVLGTPQSCIRDLGRALSELIRHEANEIFAHADVDIMGAPGECHTLVAQGEERRCEEAIARAEAIAGAPYREVCRQAAERGLCAPNSPRWMEAVGRYYARTFPF
jgi:hypothetical protein